MLQTPIQCGRFVAERAGERDPFTVRDGERPQFEPFRDVDAHRVQQLAALLLDVRTRLAAGMPAGKRDRKLRGVYSADFDAHGLTLSDGMAHMELETQKVGDDLGRFEELLAHMASAMPAHPEVRCERRPAREQLRGAVRHLADMLGSFGLTAMADEARRVAHDDRLLDSVPTMLRAWHALVKTSEACEAAAGPVKHSA